MKRSVAQRASAAFSLVEVALAMGVASFCLIAVLGLVPLGIDTNMKASDQAACNSILTHVVADLRATPMTSPPGNAATSAEYGLKIPQHGTESPNSPATLYFGINDQQFSLSPTATTSRYRLTATFLPPPTPGPGVPTPAPGTSDRTATRVALLLSWPALIDPNAASTSKPAGRVRIIANLDRN